MEEADKSAPTVKVVGFEVSNISEDGNPAEININAGVGGDEATTTETKEGTTDAPPQVPSYEEEVFEQRQEPRGMGASAASAEAEGKEEFTGGDGEGSDVTTTTTVPAATATVVISTDPPFVEEARLPSAQATVEGVEISLVTDQTLDQFETDKYGSTASDMSAARPPPQSEAEQQTKQQQQQQQPQASVSDNAVEQSGGAGGEQAVAKHHLSLRSPVMILPQTDTMTMSPMHGHQRRTVDTIFLEESEKQKQHNMPLVDDDASSLPLAAAPVAAADSPPAQASDDTKMKQEEQDPLPPPTQQKLPSAPTPTPAPPPPASSSAAEAGSNTKEGVAGAAKKQMENLTISEREDQGTSTDGKKSKKEKGSQGGKASQGGGGKDFVKKDKPKLTRAERREIQERQRAAKAALKAEQQGGGGGKKGDKQDKSNVLSRPPSGPQREFDNEKRIQRQKRKSLVPRETQVKSVKLFSHLPQFDNKPLLKSFQSLLFSGLHPEVVKLGQAYANLSISGANARCLAMLAIFKLVIQDYNTPPGKSLTRDLTNHINVIIQFLIDCRPLAVTMGNAIRFFKTKIGSIHPSTPDMEAKKILVETIDQFIQDKVIDASNTIAEVASAKIQEGDVILTYAFSSSVLKTFQAAHKRGCHFRVIVVDSRPHFEGKKLVSRLFSMGISCTYAYITSLSYILPQVTTVFVGAASALANGTVVSRVGTAAVAVTAEAFNIPVVVCCETYKFSHRVQLDAITHNELGDPDALVEVENRPDVKLLQNWNDLPNLRLLNLRYDALADRYITMIATEMGMIPPSSVPVILREYNTMGPNLL